MDEHIQEPIKCCRNCQHPMQDDAQYCEQCGQKYTTGRITFRALFREFIEEVFSLDSKIFKTLSTLFVPGKLTNEYFAGRHRRYFPPIRLFFVTAVVFFAFLSIVIMKNEDKDAGLSNVESGLLENAYRAKFMKEFATAGDSIIQQTSQNATVATTLDTLRYFLEAPNKDDRDFNYIYLTENWGIKDTSIVIDYQDLVAISQDSFFTKYQIKGAITQAVVKQQIRLQTNPEDFMRYVLGQMIWMVLLMMPILALILKFFYIRRNRYYIEHLIFSFHYHAFGFVLFSLPLLIAVLPFELSVQYKTTLVVCQDLIFGLKNSFKIQFWGRSP